MCGGVGQGAVLDDAAQADVQARSDDRANPVVSSGLGRGGRPCDADRASSRASNVLFDNIGVGGGKFTLDATDTTIATNVPPGAPIGPVKISVAVPGVPGGQLDSGSAEFQVTPARPSMRS